MRLVDADEIVNKFDPNTWQGEMMINIVNRLSTAYDVDKVVEKLETIRECRQYDAERSLHNGNEFMEYGYNCEISGIDKAIYIIKEGVVKDE